ncbi:MAG: polysaccharide export protein, partial [Paracoccaceae bacterium]|nr:polysaccharide export protein [Paracoccaceae bacterium]
MQLPTLVRFKTVFSIGLICALGACALPKSGPGRDGILENISAAPGSSAFVLVDPEVARLT